MDRAVVRVSQGNLAYCGSADPQDRRAWYVVETLPRKEQLAVTNLKQQNFPCFDPRFKKIRRHARRTDTILAPLFPNYVFVHIDKEQYPWRSINGTMGVKRLVGSERGLPRPMPHQVMELLRARCSNNIISRMIDEILPGKKVRLLYGPLADCIGSVESLDDKDRVKVLLDLLGRNISVRVDVDCIAPAL